MKALYLIRTLTQGTLDVSASDVNSPLSPLGYKLQLNCWSGMCCANHCQFAVSHPQQEEGEEGRGELEKEGGRDVTPAMSVCMLDAARPLRARARDCTGERERRKLVYSARNRHPWPEGESEEAGFTQLRLGKQFTPL